MPVSSYPRVTVQGTGTAQNTQNGQALMLVNPSTGKYEAATSATFAGGGGGGDATAANQATQITEAQTTNLGLGDISFFTQGTKDNLFDNGAGLSAANLLEDIRISKLTDGDGNGAARILSYIDNKTTTIQKYSKFNTFYSKVFEDHEGGNNITLNGAVKIVFNQNTDVDSLFDMDGNNVTASYVSSTRTKKGVHVGSEIICIYNGTNDRFDEITLGAVGVFTAYYLFDPNI